MLHQVINLLSVRLGFVCLGDTCSTAEMASELSGSRLQFGSKLLNRLQLALITISPPHLRLGIFRFTNMFACLAGIVAPLLVSALQESFDLRHYHRLLPDLHHNLLGFRQRRTATMGSQQIHKRRRVREKQKKSEGNQIIGLIIGL